ncbi:MAG: hypothetical protein NXH75_06060 [Halobacteriovoraceae bacterium]|nr:hypothetical protein [Halobacteriovoraceae bacterium]
MLTSPRIFQAFLAFAFLYLFSSVPPLTHVKAAYSLADLEVLRDGNNYQEFFQHAKDILPTKRDKHWQDMLSNMASDFVDNLRRRKKFDQSSFKKVESLAKWPEQRRDEFFQVKRQAYAIDYFKACLSSLTGDNPAPSKTQCQKQMISFWTNSSKEVETAYQMLLLQVGFFPGQKTWRYLQTIVSSQVSNIYCERPIVKEAFLDRLHDLDLEQENRSSLQFKIKGMATEECWKNINPNLLSAIDELPTRESLNLYRIGNILQILPKETQNLWLVRYFLESPTPGKTFNQAWNVLSKLSQNYDGRMKVLNRLLKYDPLPGDVFSIHDKKKRRIMTVYLSENFPEYVQKYASTCMNYLTGNQTFPRGNPTKECHDLIQMDRTLGKKNLVSDEIHLKYSAIEKRMGK